MNRARDVSDAIGRAVYALISISLLVISLTMMGVALWDVWLSLHEQALLVTSLLNAIGLIVIGMAVFDVSKFLLEEEVFSSSRGKSPAKQRQALIKFLVIIAIAISLESLVFVFDAGSKDIAMLIYPTFLLIAAILIVVGLGVYQRLTRDDGK